MSIVIAVANTSRIVVKSDGLVRDQETGEIKSNDNENMLNLNSGCIVGYTGFNPQCEEILSEYKRLASEAKVDINTLKPTTVIYDLCELAKILNTNNIMISFLTAGIEDGRIVLFGFTSEDGYEISNFTPENDQHIKYITFGIDMQKNIVPYSKYYRGAFGIEKTMNDYIRYISSNDSNVNDHIFTRKIKKSEN